MDFKAQLGAGHLKNYGWALFVIVIIIVSLLFLLSQSTPPLTCSMDPSSNTLSYVNHTINLDTLTLNIKNDSGAEISGVTYAFGQDFNAGAITLNPPTSFDSNATKTLTATRIGIGMGFSYNGTITITYNTNGVSQVVVANCTGRAN